MARILVIDDETVISDMLVDILTDEGYEVVSASDGQQALALLRQFQPDLVLSDIMMPILNGRQFCQQMRAMPEFSRVPLVFMSAAGASVSRSDCDFSGFINKPFDLDDLLSTVEALVGHSKVHY